MAKRKSFVILYLSNSLTFYMFPPLTAIERAGGRLGLANVRLYIHIYVYIIIHVRGLQKLSDSTDVFLFTRYKRKRRRWTWQVGVAIIAAETLLFRRALEGRLKCIWKKKSTSRCHCGTIPAGKDLLGGDVVITPLHLGLKKKIVLTVTSEFHDVDNTV